MEAEDWLEELSGYPQWAIERAVRWWKSEANANRRKRPFEGDIAARCKIEMAGVPTASMMLDLRQNGKYEEILPAPREKMSAERAAAIMAEVGFEPKRMPGVE